VKFAYNASAAFVSSLTAPPPPGVHNVKLPILYRIVSQFNFVHTSPLSTCVLTSPSFPSQVTR